MVQSFYEKMLETIRKGRRDAYICYEERHSYGEMYDNMLRINSLLSGYRNKQVVVFGGKDFPTYCALFAVILSGNTWVPMNPDFPTDRVLEMLRVADPEVLLVDRDLPAPLAAFAEEEGIGVFHLDDMLAGNDKAAFDIARIKPDDSAVIYFTSGSTGIPKGVPLTHANYSKTVENLLTILPFRKGEVFADYHDLGFVISIPILFPCVMTESAISPAKDKMDLIVPDRHLAANGITVLVTVPSTIARIRRIKRDGLKDVSLHILNSCGEPLYLDILEYMLDKMDAKYINNFYGSTEVSCWTFLHECGRKDLERFKSFGVCPIGNLLPGTEMRIGENEELMVSGVQVTSGYLGNVNPEAIVEIDGNRWYRTGDKAIEFEDVFVCKGRLDSQIKISGYRIELMDTEAHLRSMDGVDAAICFADTNNADTFIVAALHSARDVSPREVFEFLKERLPRYMIPSRVFSLAEMPLNKSGKIDRVGVRNHYFEGM